MITKTELKKQTPTLYNFLLDKSIIHRYITHVNKELDKTYDITGIVGMFTNVFLYSTDWAYDGGLWADCHEEYRSMYNDN